MSSHRGEVRRRPASPPGKGVQLLGQFLQFLEQRPDAAGRRIRVAQGSFCSPSASPPSRSRRCTPLMV
ncbi:hypothetical protein [Dankookia sp. P2]|uniref:hypothetical protein n=1 Tax=Dankookia sp. P2 TaxID=3423955 RepID=UPI003D67AA2C